MAGPSPRPETHPPLVPTGRTRSRWPGRQARPSGGRLTQPPSNAAEPGRPAPPPPRLSSGRPRRPRIPAPGARGGSTRARRRAPGRPGRARLPGLRARRAPPRSRLQVRRGVRPPVTAPHGDKPALRCPGSAAAREASPRGGLAALRSRVRERLAFPHRAALRGSSSAQALDCAAWIVLPRVGVGKETRAGKSSEGCTCFWDLTRPGDNPVHQTGPHPYPPAPDRMQPWRVPSTEFFFFFFLGRGNDLEPRAPPHPTGYTLKTAALLINFNYNHSASTCLNLALYPRTSPECFYQASLSPLVWEAVLVGELMSIY